MNKLLIISILLLFALITNAQEIKISDSPNVNSDNHLILNQNGTTMKITFEVLSSESNNEIEARLNDTLSVDSILNNTPLTGIPTAPTAVAGTNNTQIATTAFVLNNSSTKNNLADGLRALGSTYKAMTFGLNNPGATTYTLVSGTIYFVKIYFDSIITVTSITVGETIQGNYTGNNYNGVGLYTYKNGTYTLVASSINNANCWKTSYYPIEFKLSTPYIASKGMYVIGLLYNSSSQVTAPVLVGGTVWSSLGWQSLVGTNKFHTTLAGQKSLPSITTDAACTTIYTPILAIIK